MPNLSSKTGDTPPRKPRADGQRSRDAILLAAARAASLHGFEGLSLGKLAADLGISKSGLYAHFGSKEDLELATVGAAEKIFGEQVVARVRDARPGLARLRAVADAFFDHIRSGVFPGGCFFAAVAAGLVAQPGRVRDRVMGCVGDWHALLGRCVGEAIERRELRPDTDPDQLVFEVNAMLQAATKAFAMTGDASAFDRALRSIEQSIRRNTPDAA
ncbi:MAG: TetR/AcrR family transcriptional regulator [Phycisphaerales bacterium]|nr:TetR/AcrR family transcriptional regulator [Phycisphaerales bacterium]